MSAQSRLTLNLGSNEAGQKRYSEYNEKAKEFGFRGASAMVCEIIDWVARQVKWTPGQGPTKISGWTKNKPGA